MPSAVVRSLAPCFVTSFVKHAFISSTVEGTSAGVGAAREAPGAATPTEDAPSGLYPTGSSTLVERIPALLGFCVSASHSSVAWAWQPRSGESSRSARVSHSQPELRSSGVCRYRWPSMDQIQPMRLRNSRQLASAPPKPSAGAPART